VLGDAWEARREGDRGFKTSNCLETSRPQSGHGVKGMGGGSTMLAADPPTALAAGYEMEAPFNRTRPVAEGFCAAAVATPINLFDVDTVVASFDAPT